MLLPLHSWQFIPDAQGTFMEWSFEGVTCHGVFKPESSVAIFNFCLQDSMVTITYRVLDASSTSARSPLACSVHILMLHALTD